MLFSIGHSSLTQEEFLALAARLGVVVDVRSHPASRHSPHFNRAELERWLPRAGIAYEWLPALGGWRGRSGRPPEGDAALPAGKGVLNRPGFNGDSIA